MTIIRSIINYFGSGTPSSSLLMVIIILLITNPTNSTSSSLLQHQSRKSTTTTQLRDDVFNHVWRGFLDDDSQSYKSQIFSLKINNSTNTVDVYIVRTSDGEHLIRKYPVYLHLTGEYILKDNLTNSIDLSVFNLQCENLALPNGLADPTGCQQYSSFWLSGARYLYSVFDVDEDDEMNYYVNIRNEESTLSTLWKGPVYQVDPLASICPMSENWKLENDMFGRVSETGYALFKSDGTYTMQVNEAIDFSKARGLCKLQENFLTMKVQGRYQYFPELGILLTIRSTCRDLQYWVEDVVECNLCSRREQAFGLSSIVTFDTCAAATLQVENLSNKYNALRISRAFDPPLPKEYETQPVQPCDNNEMHIAIGISVVALILVFVILGVIGCWVFIYLKNRRTRPVYKPLE